MSKEEHGIETDKRRSRGKLALDILLKQTNKTLKPKSYSQYWWLLEIQLPVPYLSGFLLQS